MNKKQAYEKFEEMKELMGADALLEELFDALSSDEAEENLKWIDQNNNLGIFEDE